MYIRVPDCCFNTEFKTCERILQVFLYVFFMIAWFSQDSDHLKSKCLAIPSDQILLKCIQIEIICYWQVLMVSELQSRFEVLVKRHSYQTLIMYELIFYRSFTDYLVVAGLN